MWRKMGYSSATPLAPRMSRAMRAHSRAIQTLFRLAMEMCCGAALSLSLRRPTCSTSNCPLVIPERFRFWYAHVLQGEARSHGPGQRPFGVNVFGPEARPVRFHQKAANIVVFFFHFRPDHSNIRDGA